MPSPRLGAAGLILLAVTASCRTEEKQEKQPEEKPAAPAKPKTLYLPSEAQDPSVVDLKSPEAHIAKDVSFGPGASTSAVSAAGRCPHDMVDVAGAFCIDRFEVSLVDAKSNRDLSPHYPPSQHYTTLVFERWTKKAPRSGRALGREIPVPTPPAFQLTEEFAPRARSIRAQVPAGYLTRTLAEAACKNAGKRLCSRQEWVRACRGETNTKYPYGDKYEAGTCNVHRESHPARLLHGDASKNHLDPRLGLAYDDDGPLLLTTGDASECVSRWGSDGIYDMVGNLDEWIEDPSGVFLGGFFSRATKEGCGSYIDVHDPGYLDYSLGTRCCQD